jgi:outer membrane protein
MRMPQLITILAGAFLSQALHAENLLQVYQEALANDPVYASARASLAAGAEKLPQGRAGLLPQVAVSGGYSQTNLYFVNPPVGSRDFFSNGYTVSLAQPLFRWSNWEQYEQGKLAVAVSQAQFAQAQQDLIIRVGQAYFDVLTAQDALASVQAQETAITEQLASAKRNFEVGTATITDTHEAQARFDLAKAQALAAENDLQIKRTALQQIIGKPPTDLATLRDGVQLNGPNPVGVEPWVANAEQQNYGVISQQLALEIATREIKRDRAGHLPTLDLVASRNHTTQSGSTITQIGSTTNATTVGIQWNIPLFSGFAVTSKVREAIALEDKARNDLETARRTAAQSARQSYLGVNSGLAQVKALEAAEASSKLALESNKLGYQVGVRINIDVLNAQQQVYATQRDLAKARYDTIMNGFRLKSAAGTLNEDDLAQVNALLIEKPAAASSATSANPAPQVASNTAPSAPRPNAQGAGTAPVDVERDAVLATLNGWARAWSTRNVDSYLNFYGNNFKPGHGLSRQAWAQERRARIEGKHNIEVKVESPQIRIENGIATATFIQDYQSDHLAEKSNKTLLLSRQDGEWKILLERASN